MHAIPELEFTGLSHQGMIRKDNQDSLLLMEPAERGQLEERGRLFVVADGLGGHRGGSVASKMAVDVIGEEYYRSDLEGIYPNLLGALEKANTRIYDTSASRLDLQGMATTCTAVVVYGNQLFLAHVGDSRAYLIRDGEIRQISTDHTLVEEMVISGILSHEEARSHPDSHILTRSLGIQRSVEVDILEPPIQLQEGDRLLLCSDGLTTYLDDREILRTVRENQIQEACQTLVDVANERGGRDNITVGIIRIGSGPEEMDQPEQPSSSVSAIVGSESRSLGGGRASGTGWALLLYVLLGILFVLYFLMGKPFSGH